MVSDVGVLALGLFGQFLQSKTAALLLRNQATPEGGRGLVPYGFRSAIAVLKRKTRLKHGLRSAMPLLMRLEGSDFFARQKSSSKVGDFEIDCLLGFRFSSYVENLTSES